MTTGRINQVTISVCTRIRNPQVQHRYRRPKTLSSVGVRYKAFQQCLCEFPHSYKAHSAREDLLSTSVTSERNTLFLDLTQFQDQLSLSKGQRSRPSVKTTSNRLHLKSCAQSRRISYSCIANWFNHR